MDPLFFLGLSILLVAVSLTAVLVMALPTILELARAARSVERLAETLMRELPPTLDSIRRTGIELSDLTDDMSQGVHRAGQVVRQVDDGLSQVRRQARHAQVTTRSILAGAQAAWKSLHRGRQQAKQRAKKSHRRRQSMLSGRSQQHEPRAAEHRPQIRPEPNPSSLPSSPEEHRRTSPSRQRSRPSPSLRSDHPTIASDRESSSPLGRQPDNGASDQPDPQPPA